MKKLLIGMLITCSLGLAGCGRADTENPSNGNPSTGVTDGTNGNGANSSGTSISDGTNGNGTNNSGAGMTDGTNGNGATDGTNSNENGTNNQDAALNQTRTSLNNLYTEFKGKVEGGVENIKAEDWDKYSTEFKQKLTNLRNTVGNTSMSTTVDDMENLFNDYDKPIREKTDVAKDKVEQMQKKIENELK